MENKFYVYAYLRAVESPNGPAGSPYYVGKGNGLRAYSKGRAVKPPEDRSRIVILSDKLSEDEAFRQEKVLIAFYGRISNGNGCLRNMTDGGEGISGFRWKRGPLPPAHVAKLRVLFTARRGKPGTPHTEEAKNRIRIKLTGVKHTAERVRKMSIAKKGQRNSPATEFKKGQKHSPEMITKMAATMKGRTNNPLGFIGNHTEKTKAKISEKLREAWARRKAIGPVTFKRSAETREKLRIAALRRYGKAA